MYILMAVVTGAGWGWPDPSQTFILQMLCLGGAGTGMTHALFAWCTSRKFFLYTLIELIVLNLALFLIQYFVHFDGYLTVFLLATAIGNFGLLVVWLLKAARLAPWNDISA